MFQSLQSVDPPIALAAEPPRLCRISTVVSMYRGKRTLSILFDEFVPSKSAHE